MRQVTFSSFTMDVVVDNCCGRLLSQVLPFFAPGSTPLQASVADSSSGGGEGGRTVTITVIIAAVVVVVAIVIGVVLVRRNQQRNAPPPPGSGGELETSFSNPLYSVHRPQIPVGVLPSDQNAPDDNEAGYVDCVVDRLFPSCGCEGGLFFNVRLTRRCCTALLESTALGRLGMRPMRVTRTALHTPSRIGGITTVMQMPS